MAYPQNYERRAPAKPARNIHWRAPAFMASSFLVGIAFALGHHLFYLSKNGEAVGDETEQKWVTRAGSAASFIVKMSLATSTSVAYTQWLWFRLRNEPARIERLDTMFGVLSNASEFFKLRFWLTHPLLALPAVITWLLPLSAVVSQGTIVVQPTKETDEQAMNIKQRDYINGNYAVWASIPPYNAAFFEGADASLGSTGLLTLGQDAIVSIPRDFSDRNLTYDTRFQGPAVTCSRADNITTSFVNRAAAEYEAAVQVALRFAAWVPQPGFEPTMNGSFFNQTGVIDGDSSLINRIDFVSPDASRLYVRVALSANAHLISCKFYNASYDVHFELPSGGSQTVTATKSFLNWFRANESVEFPGENSVGNEVQEFLNYEGVITSFGTYLRGQQGVAYNTSLGQTVNMAILYTSTLMEEAAQNADSDQGLDFFMSSIEALMQNITLGLRYGGVTDHASGLEPVFYPITVNATVSWFENQYLYAPRDLIISYGLSIGWALVCVVLGVVAICMNGASYTNNFSTFTRVTRDPELDRLIEVGEDRNGADPLPEHIADAIVMLKERDEKEKGLSQEFEVIGPPGWV